MYANTFPIVAYKNLFGFAVPFDYYETEQEIQKKKASYKDIQKWIRETFNEHVTNLDISRTKKECGLAQYEYKGRKPAAGYYVPKKREKKQEMVVKAFEHFGLIDRK